MGSIDERMLKLQRIKIDSDEEFVVEVEHRGMMKVCEFIVRLDAIEFGPGGAKYAISTYSNEKNEVLYNYTR